MDPTNNKLLSCITNLLNTLNNCKFEDDTNNYIFNIEKTCNDVDIIKKELKQIRDSTSELLNVIKKDIENKNRYMNDDPFEIAKKYNSIATRKKTPNLKFDPVHPHINKPPNFINPMYFHPIQPISTPSQLKYEDSSYTTYQHHNVPTISSLQKMELYKKP